MNDRTPASIELIDHDIVNPQGATVVGPFSSEFQANEYLRRRRLKYPGLYANLIVAISYDASKHR